MAYLSLDAKVFIIVFTIFGVFLAALLCYCLIKKDTNTDDNIERGSESEGSKQPQESVVAETGSTGGSDSRPEPMCSTQIPQQRSQDSVVAETGSAGASYPRLESELESAPPAPNPQIQRQQPRMPELQRVGRHQGYELHEGSTESPLAAQIEDYTP